MSLAAIWPAAEEAAEAEADAAALGAFERLGALSACRLLGRMDGEFGAELVEVLLGAAGAAAGGAGGEGRDEGLRDEVAMGGIIRSAGALCALHAGERAHGCGCAPPLPTIA